MASIFRGVLKPIKATIQNLSRKEDPRDDVGNPTKKSKNEKVVLMKSDHEFLTELKVNCQKGCNDRQS